MARLLRARLHEGTIELPVTGASMAGVIENGSTVRLEPAPEPRRGEVWAFVNDDGGLTVHRIREIDATTITGRGSGNRRDDPPVPRDRLVGRVRRAVSADGTETRFDRRDRVLADAGFRLRRLLRPLRRRPST